MGTLVFGIVTPIIGPPLIILVGLSVNPPAASISSWKEVPTLTKKSCGWDIAPPVTVTILDIRGLPSTTASYMAYAVPTFWTIHPISAGNLPVGTSLFNIADISCFSEHWGYFVYKIFTSILLETPQPTVHIQYGIILLSSIPISLAFEIDVTLY